MNLEESRRKIDEIDRTIAKLFEERMETVSHVAAYKKENNMQIFQPAREQDIFLRRYFFVEESEAIAKRYGMKKATVQRTLSRTREKLKNYLIKEGYAV